MCKRSKIEEDALRAIERSNRPMTIEEAKEFMKMQYDAEWDQYRREAAMRFMAIGVKIGVTPPEGKDALTFAAETAVEAADALILQLNKTVASKEEAEQESKSSDDSEPDGITLVEHDGLKWVRIKIFDEDFMLCTKNLVGEDGMKEFKWQEAVDETEKRGWTMPNKKQWDLVDAYRDQIDKLIEEAGGDSLNDLFWSVARYYSDGAWFYYGFNGKLDGNYLSRTYSVRPLAYFKKS